MTKWTEKEDKYLRENYNQRSVRELAQFLDRTVSAVQVRKKKLSLTNPSEFWTNQEISFLKKIYGTIPNKKIVRLLKEKFGIERTAVSVRTKGSKLKISRKGYSANSSFFDNPNLTNCYYAGLIAADGSINDRLSESTLSKRLRIELHLLDKNILNEFIVDTGFTGSLRITGNGYALLDICCCQQWFDSLERIFSITPRKCKTQLPTENESILYPPVGLTLEQKVAFLIGLIDGDGWIIISYKKPYRALSFGLVGSNPMMLWVRNIIKELNLFNMEACLNINSASSVFSIATSGKKAETLCKYLMSINTPKMARKWVIAKAWLNKDDEIINGYINNRGKKMQAWKGVLKVFEKRGLEPEMYYYEE